MRKTKQKIVDFFENSEADKTFSPTEVSRALDMDERTTQTIFKGLAKKNYLIPVVKAGKKRPVYRRSILINCHGTFRENTNTLDPKHSVSDPKHSVFEKYFSDYSESSFFNPKHSVSTDFRPKKHSVYEKPASHIYTIITLLRECIVKREEREEREILYGKFFALQEMKNFLSTYPGKTLFSEKALSLFEKMPENEFEEFANFFEKRFFPLLEKMKNPVLKETPVSLKEEKEETISTEPALLRKAREHLKKSNSRTKHIRPDSYYFEQPIPFTKKEQNKAELLEPDSCHIRYRNETPLKRDYTFYREMLDETNKEREVPLKKPTPKQFVANSKKAIQTRKAAHFGRQRADALKAKYSDYGKAIIFNGKTEMKHRNYIQPRNFGAEIIQDFYSAYFRERLDEFRINHEDIKYGAHELLPERFDPDFDDADENARNLFWDQIMFYREVLLECDRIYNAKPTTYTYLQKVEEAIETKLIPLSFVQDYDFHKDNRLKGFFHVEESKLSLGYKGR